MSVDVVEEKDHFCEPLHLSHTVRDGKSIYANVKRPWTVEYLPVKNRYSHVNFFKHVEIYI